MRSCRSDSVEEKEELILELVTIYKEQNGFSPTIREICKHTGLSSTSTVHAYVHNLIDKGMMSSKPEMPRTMNVSVSRYKSDHNNNVIQINNIAETIPFTFNLNRTSINILNKYCEKKGVSADEALDRALQLLTFIKM